MDPLSVGNILDPTCHGLIPTMPDEQGQLPICVWRVSDYHPGTSTPGSTSCYIYETAARDLGNIPTMVPAQESERCVIVIAVLELEGEGLD